METRTITVADHLKMEARVAASVVLAVDGFASQVTVRRGEFVADAGSILDLMLLGASAGSVIHVAASGEDEKRAIAVITELVLEGLDGTEKAGGARRRPRRLESRR